MHARKNYRAGTNPDILAYDNRARGDIPPSVGFEPVIFRNKLNLRRDESIIAYGDSAPVHKCAAEIYEYALAHAYIPPEIGIKRRIQIKIFAYRRPVISLKYLRAVAASQTVVFISCVSRFAFAMIFLILP